jgi:hypothetical protein
VTVRRRCRRFLFARECRVASGAETACGMMVAAFHAFMGALSTVEAYRCVAPAIGEGASAFDALWPRILLDKPEPRWANPGA